MLGYEILSCTCTHTSCCVPRPSILHAEGPDGLWKDLLFYLHRHLDLLLYLHRQLILCKTFYSTLAGNWCNFKRSYRIFSPSSIDAWCYVTRSCLVRAQTPHIAFQDLLFYMRKHLMVSERIFSCTCTDAWCYINRHCLVLAQTLVVIRSSLVLARLHRRFVWCYVKRSSLVLAQTLDATLQGAGQKGGPYYPGAGTGPETGTIHVYAHRHRCKWFIFVYKQRRFCLFARSNKPRQWIMHLDLMTLTIQMVLISGLDWSNCRFLEQQTNVKEWSTDRWFEVQAWMMNDPNKNPKWKNTKLVPLFKSLFLPANLSRCSNL